LHLERHSFLHSKGRCSGINFLQTNRSLVKCSSKAFIHLRAMNTRLNFFRLGLHFLLRCLEWVSLPMTSTHLWNCPKNAKNDNLLKTKIILKPKY